MITHVLYSLLALWPTFHGDNARAGASGAVGQIPAPNLLWSYNGGWTYDWASPTAADIDGDGIPEVVAAGSNAYVYALNGEDGSLLWSFTPGASQQFETTPALADLDGDGLADVVAPNISNQTLYALKGTNGAVLWTYALAGGSDASPLCADVDGDGIVEVLITSFGNTLYCFNGEDGSVLWTYALPAGSWSPPSAADVDGDGLLEVAFGCTDNRVYVVNGEDGSLVWSYLTGGNVNAAVAIGNLDGVGLPELVTMSTDNNTVYALRADGTLYWQVQLDALGVNGNVLRSTPAVADVDGDGQMEVVACSRNLGQVVALNGQTGAQEWAAALGNTIDSSPAVADVDNDGMPEVLVGNWDYSLYCLNGESGTTLWSYLTGNWVRSSPAVTDADNDGGAEVAFCSWDGFVYVIDSDPLSVGIGEEKPAPTLALLRGRTLAIIGAAPGSQVAVYDVAGRLALQRTITGPSARVSLASLPAGVYVARVGSATLRLTLF